MLDLFESQYGLILNYGEGYGAGGEGHIRLNLGTQQSMLRRGCNASKQHCSGNVCNLSP